MSPAVAWSELAQEVQRAAERLAPILPATPLRRSFWLSESIGADVWLKCENLQPTGSFKVRGALNRLLCEDSVQHVVAASTGNHGAAVAFAARHIGVDRTTAERGVTDVAAASPPTCTVFVPEGTASAKLSSMRRLGAEIRVVGTDSLESELAARAFAEKQGALYVSPYNDPLVVAGQGTAALEIERQLEAAGRGPAEVVVAALGGGGLVSGLAAGLGRGADQAAGPGRTGRLVAASPANSKVMHESVRAGKILELPSRPTLSDGTAGGVEPGAVTFEWVREGVDEFVVVEESTIAATLCECIAEERLLIEGAAAVAVAGAAAPSIRERVQGRTVVIVLCGANLAASKLAQLLAEYAGPAD